MSSFFRFSSFGFQVKNSFNDFFFLSNSNHFPTQTSSRFCFCPIALQTLQSFKFLIHTNQRSKKDGKKIKTMESRFFSARSPSIWMSIFELDLSLIFLCTVAMNVLYFFLLPVDDFISLQIKYKFTFCLKHSFALSLI